MKELIRVRVQYASRQQCCKTHKRPLPFYLQTPEFSSIATRLQTGRLKNLGSIPGRPSNFIFTAPPPALRPIQPLPNNTGVPSRKMRDRSVRMITQLHCILRILMIRATPHSRIRLNGVVFQSTVTTVPFLYIQKI